SRRRKPSRSTTPGSRAPGNRCTPCMAERTSSSRTPPASWATSRSRCSTNTRPSRGSSPRPSGSPRSSPSRCTAGCAGSSSGRPPAGFVVTLPKVVSPEQVSVLIDVFEELERALGLSRGALKMESMIETTQSILDEHGESMLPKLLAAARGRCVAAHFGTYDYTASCDITAKYQSMRHPACDFAKHMMKVAYAGTGIWLSDGATTLMPVAPHKAAKGAQLTAEQARENQRAVHGAWRLHADDVRHSLVNGYYQGWDLHPAQ